ncbi:MAG: PLP-dependent lyase/thiolase [Candidatus Diapherotrites archaeon]|jgi:threonine dehydratase|nr:PLP-dependent lyase/thiolase [Candidatus Diapherotrites archaeon]MBT4597136.1 PLP-dependent lyase/thiolase [Candidatus Diapherotrites archaeon]
MGLTEKEENILASIKVASENNPNRPEFPVDDPKFPATPTFEIDVPGFENVWLKDESINPTGTHKDRMAWEMIVTYRDFLLAKKRQQTKGHLPHMSLITSGSAGIAIQTQLRKYNLPNLKVLVDENTNGKIVRALEKLKCEIYTTNLNFKALNWRDILYLTENQNGIDITSNEALGSTIRYYDWMSYEIINSSPDYCFIPFGTGNLYENVLNVNRVETSTQNHDPRFAGDKDKLRNCNFLGATTNDPISKADKLYSPHLPFVHYDEQWIRTYRQSGFCGIESQVHLIKEHHLNRAIELAEKQGVVCEPSGITGLALMLQLEKRLPKNKKMLIVNTGKTKFPE